MKKILLSFSLILFSTTIIVSQNNYMGGIDTNAPTKEMRSTAAFCDSIFSFPTLDSWPAGIASDGNYIWCNSGNGVYIHKYSFTGTLIDSIPNPGGVFSSTVGGDMDFEGILLIFLA